MKVGQIVSRAFVIVLVLCLVFFGVYSCFSTRYWKSQGNGDVFRVPLEYPYQLEMIDVVGNAWLGTWSRRAGEPSLQVSNIQQIWKSGDVVIGRTGHETKPVYMWFLLDCASGEVQVFADEGELEVAAGLLGVQEIGELVSLREYWDGY